MKKEGIFHTLCVFLQKNKKGFRHFNSLQIFRAAARDSFALATAPFCALKAKALVSINSYDF